MRNPPVSPRSKRPRHQSLTLYDRAIEFHAELFYGMINTLRLGDDMWHKDNASKHAIVYLRASQQ
eukprot:11279912-Prorocentrum_lima.AAC.1